MTSKGAQGIRQLSLAGALGVLLAALAASCGGATADTAVMGSESHFLTRCSASCGGGFECIGGLCTRACLTGADTCSELHDGAVCTNESVEPGQVAVCDVPCSGDDVCGGLGSGFACDGAFCREPVDATLEVPSPSAEACESFLDSVPPPVVTGVTITNTSDVTLYVQPYSPSCPGNPGYEPALVHVSTIGPSDSGEELNIHGGGCLPICQSVIESGWDGTSGPACPQQDCSMLTPLPWVAILPGQSAFEPAKLEYVQQALPQDCAQRIVSDVLPCMARRIPSDGAYMITVVVSASADCDPALGCIGQNFGRPVGNYFQENHTLEITAPAQ